MATEAVRLEKEARRLRRAFGVHGPDQVLVLVVGPCGELVSRKTLRGPVDMRQLRLRLAGAEVAVEGIANEPTAPGPRLTRAEAALLDQAGLEEGERDRPGAFEKSAIEFQLLVAGALALPAAAKRLGVTPSRLRQRLMQGTLYGIKDGRAWRIPAFQLDAKRRRLVRGIEKVLPSVDRNAHPLAVAAWFSTPHQDLVVKENEASVTPLQWLEGGRSAEIVADLAKEI